MNTLTIDVISDVVCPWCFIGKRHLEAALRQFREEFPDSEAPEVRWLPFQLNPHLPVEGVSRKSYLEEKFGGPERAREIYARVSKAGQAAGIGFDFDRMTVQPNTLDAHRLIHAAAPLKVQDAMVETLFQAYFLEGADLTQTQTLDTLALRAGFGAQAQTYLHGEENRNLVASLDHRARQMGISGVPFFIFNGRYALSGAQPPEVILQALRRAHEDPIPGPAN
ncbi:MAG: DsbA family oxidoreductase [Betaproteobacteria bacterium]|nr:DsbA family oxidoreductase [Betaproteobacteria bacterium]